MTEKTMIKADFYTSVVLMAFGITVTVMAVKMPVIERDPYSSPGVLPAVLGVIITGLSFFMLIRSLYRSKGHLGVPGNSVKSFLKEIATRKMIVTIVLCLLYVFLLGKVQFSLLTFLYVFIFIVFFECDRKIPVVQQKKKLLIAGIVAVLSAVLITVVFQYLFLVRLP